MPSITSKTHQLPEALGMYVDALRKQYPSIEQVWLVGPHVNSTEARGKEWDLVAFADAKVLRSVRSDPQWHRDDLSLMIVVDGDRYERAWGGSDSGALTEIEWRLEDPHCATYRGAPDGTPDPQGSRSSGVRVR